MDSSLNKTTSDPNLSTMERADATDITPISFVSQRFKRRRDDNYDEEFKKFKEDMMTSMSTMMKSLFSEQDKEIKKITPTLLEIKQTNSNIENSIAFLTEQNTELKNKIEVLEGQAMKDREYIIILEEKIEDLHLSSRKANLEIKNVPKYEKESKNDLINMVLSLSKSIDCEISNCDIRDIYRIKSKKDSKVNSPIIVETSSTLLKTSILKACKTFNMRHKDKLCCKHLGLHKNEDSPVFVSEQLTARGARLYFVARELTKSKKYKYCWTAYGKVYVRKDDNSPIISIKTESQVHNLMQAS